MCVCRHARCSVLCRAFTCNKILVMYTGGPGLVLSHDQALVVLLRSTALHVPDVVKGVLEVLQYLCVLLSIEVDRLLLDLVNQRLHE